MDQPLVSIVVPIYNVEKYLNRCIESIVNQTYTNLEIILVDDGSPDNCPAMCDNWAKKDKRIKVIHKENAGLGMARNTGIDSAIGKYIFFLDSDDYVDLSLVDKCVASALKYQSEVVIYGFSNDDGGHIKPKKICTDQLVFCGDIIKDQLLEDLLTYKLGFGSSCCMKMFDLELIKNKNVRFFSEREIISEDSFFILELFPNLSVVSIVPECLYFYFNNQSSLSKTFKIDRQEKNDIFLKKCMDYVVTKGLSESLSFSIQSRYHGYTLGALMQIVRSSLPKKERKKEIYKIYKNQLLHQTLIDEVLSLDSGKARFFWKLLRCRCYVLCTLLLKYNARK